MPRVATSLPRLVAAAGLTLALIATGVACSSDKAETTSHRDEPATSTTGKKSAATPAPVFAGSDDEFYVPPDPLPKGEPGDVIRVMDVGTANGVVTRKVMYHSRDAQDRDVPVTGIVSYPTAGAPKDGWPIIATAPGTAGLDAHCGVTHRAKEAPGWGVEGVRVMTDYIGLGPVGAPLHPYLSKPSEGHSVLDAVRATRQIPEAHAGDRWLSVGHSQGGHGALSASELSADYAPELKLLGTLALAPAALLDKVYDGIDPIVTSVLTAMTLYGGAGEHPEIKVEDYVTPELEAASKVFETGCLGEITEELVPLVLGGKMFKADPRRTKPASDLLIPNDVGLEQVDAPLFLVSGTKDDRVVIQRVRDLYDRLCKTGQVTELLIIDGATHDSIIGQTSKQTSAWLQDRIDGKDPVDSCSGPMPEPVPAP